MDVSKLNLTIPFFQQSVTLNTYFYGINVNYDGSKWNVSHRFNDFMRLNEQLIAAQFEGLPKPPNKTLMKLQDTGYIEFRRLALQAWLQQLCKRPDLRTSKYFLDFIEFEANTNIKVKPLTFQLTETCSTAQSSVVDIFMVPGKPMFMSISKDTTMNARMGKIWSLISRETKSSLQLWNYKNVDVPHEESENVKEFSHYAFDSLDERVNCIFYHPSTNRLFCGLENGTVRILNVDKNVGTWPFSFKQESYMELHSKAVICFKGFLQPLTGRLMSVSEDSSIRILSTETLNILCSGRIQKRLESNETVTTGTLEPLTDPNNILSSRLFLGTDFGHVFVFSCELNPPVYVTVLQVNDSVSALEVAGSNLIVAFGYSVNIYKLPKNLTDPKISYIRSYTASSSIKSRYIQSIALAQSQPLLFVGHKKCVSVWNCITHECLIIKTLHTSDITKILVIENELEQTDESNQQPLYILTSGLDGSIHKWLVPNAEELHLWQLDEKTQKDINASNSSDCIARQYSGASDGNSDDDTYKLSNYANATPHRH